MKEILTKIKNNHYNLDDNHFLFVGDCLEILKSIPDNSIKVVITDPPYNINLNYNSFRDKKSWKEYYDELKDRLTEIFRILTKDGSLYLINYPEFNARTLPILEDEIGFVFKRWITWHYPTNIGHSKTNFTRSQRSILFMTKSKNNLFNKTEVVQPYKNPKVGKIKKLIEQGKKGRTPYDGLELNDLKEILGEKEFGRDIENDFLNFNLLKNVSKDRELEHPCQLPLSLLKVFIKASSNEGDIILDSYAGTFTTSLAAKQLNRKSIGIEIDSEYVDFGLRRLKNDKEKEN
ncbi:MAG: DNA-methyltransferase [Candidatus Nanoarchaeia archaeon]